MGKREGGGDGLPLLGRPRPEAAPEERRDSPVHIPAAPKQASLLLEQSRQGRALHPARCAPAPAWFWPCCQLGLASLSSTWSRGHTLLLLPLRGAQRDCGRARGGALEPRSSLLLHSVRPVTFSLLSKEDLVSPGRLASDGSEGMPEAPAPLPRGKDPLAFLAAQQTPLLQMAQAAQWVGSLLGLQTCGSGKVTRLHTCRVTERVTGAGDQHCALLTAWARSWCSGWGGS